MAGGGVPAGQVASSYGYSTKLNFAVVITCLIGATGGFLFGYDIGVTGGVTSMSSFLEKFFPSVARKQAEASTTNYCEFDSQQLQIFTSSLFIVAAFVAIAAYKFNAWIGRRWTMCLAAFCFFVGALLDCVAVDLAMLVIGRCIMGIGVGLANSTVPLFISEMAPPHARGALGNMFQLATTIGILAAQLINYGVDKMHSHNNWRVSVGIAMVPAAILFFGSLIVSDTPHSLVSRNKNEAAIRVLRRIRGTEAVQAEYEDIVSADQAHKSVKTPYLNIFRKKYRPELSVCILMPFFQQFSGINSIMFYVPVLFRTIGSSSSSSLLSTVIVGAVNVVSTFVAIYVVDRAGRKFLFIEGGIQMVAADIVVAVLLGIWLHDYNKLSHGEAILVIVFICIFVAAFAWSWGPLAWLVPSEIQPLATRQAGQSINVFINFICTFIIGQAFLSMLCSMRWGIFLFFGAFVVLATIWIALFVPETKGVPIERMPDLWASHWFWRKFVPGGMGNAPSAGALVSVNNNAALRKDVELGGAPNGAIKG